MFKHRFKCSEIFDNTYSALPMESFEISATKLTVFKTLGGTTTSQT